MTSWIFVIMASALAVPAWAGTDVICVEDDCLTYGWQIEDEKSGRRTDVECEDENCAASGWNEYRGRRMIAYTQCLFEDCFQYGWEVRDARNHRPVLEVRCEKRAEDENHDCLRAGWTTRYMNGPELRTECVANDCRRFGWDVYYPNGQVQVARCKEEACFTKGWTLNP